MKNIILLLSIIFISITVVWTSFQSSSNSNIQTNQPNPFNNNTSSSFDQNFHIKLPLNKASNKLNALPIKQTEPLIENKEPEISDNKFIQTNKIEKTLDLNNTEQQKIIVNMTPQLYKNFHKLDDQLNDPSISSTISLAEFSNSEEILSLPRPLAIALISKLVKQYNEGKISREVFMAQPEQ